MRRFFLAGASGGPCFSFVSWPFCSPGLVSVAPAFSVIPGSALICRYHCASVSEHRNLKAVSLYEYPSSCKIPVCAFRISAKMFRPLYGWRDAEKLLSDIAAVGNDRQILSRFTLPWPKLDDTIKTLNYPSDIIA